MLSPSRLESSCPLLETQCTHTPLNASGTGSQRMDMVRPVPYHNHQSYLLPLPVIHKSDDFYVFSTPPPTSPRTPTRLPLSSSPDLLEELLKSSNDPTKIQKPAESVVELSSPKSGLKLIFGTNRALFFSPLNYNSILLTSTNHIESGVMFYSNNFASPSTGSRKKIHGGSGEVGDGYAPGCTPCLLSSFPWSLAHILFIHSCCFPRIP